MRIKRSARFYLCEKIFRAGQWSFLGPGFRERRMGHNCRANDVDICTKSNTQYFGSTHWSDEKWKSIMAKGGGHKKRFQHCTNPSGQEVLYFRALQGHSGHNLIDRSLQDKVIIPDDFFKYIYHIRCAINLHSIINSGLIPGGQNLSNRQMVLFTSVDPMDKKP